MNYQSSKRYTLYALRCKPDLEFMPDTLHDSHFTRYDIYSTNSYVRIYKLFMQNKPNSPIVQINANLFTAMIYTIFTSLTKVKNKPNSKPIQTQSNPFLKIRIFSNVNLGKYPLFYKLYAFLIKSWPKITENSEIMALFNQKGRKTTKYEKKSNLVRR